MKHIPAHKIIVLKRTFCPPAAVIISNIKKAKSGDVLHVKASRCQERMVEDVAIHLDAEVILKDKRGPTINLWILKK
ncbi:hypothetical protein [Candidatus Pyrohabitans sp.]